MNIQRLRNLATAAERDTKLTELRGRVADGSSRLRLRRLKVYGGECA